LSDVVAYDLEVPVDTALFSTDVVMRAVYRLTNRYYVFLRRHDGGILIVSLTRKSSTPTSEDPSGELANTLLDEAIRQRVRESTSAVRESIVRSALSEFSK
jgi:His-Xaa-Ser system protein HxsD